MGKEKENTNITVMRCIFFLHSLSLSLCTCECIAIISIANWYLLSDLFSLVGYVLPSFTLTILAYIVLYPSTIPPHLFDYSTSISSSYRCKNPFYYCCVRVLFFGVIAHVLYTLRVSSCLLNFASDRNLIHSK